MDNDKQENTQNVEHKDECASPPTVWPVVLWTLLFGIFGAISATLRSEKAYRCGYKVAPYWIAFAAALFIQLAFWSINSNHMMN